MIFFIIFYLLILAGSGVIFFIFSDFPDAFSFLNYITLTMPYSYLIVIFISTGLLSFYVTWAFSKKISFNQTTLIIFCLIGALAITDFIVHYPHGMNILKVDQQTMNIKGLVHGFRFEQSLKDITGKSEAINFKLPQYNSAGKSGAAYKLSPQSVFTLKSIDIPAAGAWCFWCKVKSPLSTENKMRILDANGYWIAFHKDGIVAYFKEDEFIHVTANTVIEAEKWFHVAVTWEPGKFCIYVNGRLLECNGLFKGVPAFSKRDLVVGARWNSKEKYFYGEIDELYIFNGPVNQDKIVFIMQNGLGSNTANSK